MHLIHRLLLPLGATLVLGSVMAGAPARAATLEAHTIARGLANPWAVAFLPDGRFLVTERPGRLRIVDAQGRVLPALEGLPPIAATGQCGLLDVVLHPDFASNQLVFFSFAEPAGDGSDANSTAVGRARLVGDKLLEVRTIFSQKPKLASRLHCGSRIAFARDGTLLVGLGDRFTHKDEAQNPANHLGKIVRIDIEGKAPADNPFVGKPGAAPEVYSLGHRNIQGLATQPGSGELWQTEHGPQGGDELNVIDAGRNYGWPLVTYGRNYGTGTRIGEEGPKPGFVQPIKWWLPLSVAPSGLAFVSSDRYPGWKGSLLMGTLRGEMLLRLSLEGRSVVAEEKLLLNLKERIRDVRQGPDGWIYLLTDNADGRLLRLQFVR